jgi:DNA-binding transcriptional LysR family regulator
VRRPYLRIEDLRGRQMVMFRRGYDLREATLAACRQAGFEPRFSVQGGEMDAVLRFVEAGLGVAVVPSMVLDGRPGLSGTPLAPPGLSRTIALAHRKDVEPTRAAQAFRETLLSFVVEAGHEGTLPQGVELIAE